MRGGNKQLIVSQKFLNLVKFVFFGTNFGFTEYNEPFRNKISKIKYFSIDIVMIVWMRSISFILKLKLKRS